MIEKSKNLDKELNCHLKDKYFMNLNSLQHRILIEIKGKKEDKFALIIDMDTIYKLNYC